MINSNLKIECPYCQNSAKLVDSAYIYGQSYGMMYLCEPCDAYVGTHKANGLPLGNLADKKLRRLRNKAHHFFDYLWKVKMTQGFSKKSARGKAYQWLSRELSLSASDCHIAMFNPEQCEKTIDLCKPYYRIGSE